MKLYELVYIGDDGKKKMIRLFTPSVEAITKLINNRVWGETLQSLELIPVTEINEKGEIE